MLVGRETELRRLTELLDEGRRPLLLGEAGVGKTALVRAAAAASGRRLAEAGALSTLSWLSYLPFRRLLGREPAGDAAFVAAAVEGVVGDDLLFLDDVQWADPDTRAVVALLPARVALVAAVRRGDPGVAPVVEELAAAGFTVLPLEPLTDAHARVLVEHVRPGLPRAARDALVRRAGGNPLLLEELAASGEPTESLRLSVAARLRGLDPPAREALAALALAGRPLGPGLTGAGGAALVEAGLAVRSGGRLLLRHALVGEAMAELLSADERLAVHSRLAAGLREPGEAARHHAAAGARPRARELALRAADRATHPAERADHLALAARCTDGEDALALHLAAARAFGAAGRYSAAEAELTRLDAAPPALRAEAGLVRARAVAERDDVPAVRALLDEAGALVAGTASDVELAVELERIELDLRTIDRDPGDVDRAARAVAEARRHGRLEALALGLYAQARRDAGEPGWDEDLRAAVTVARGEGDAELECRLVEALGTGLVKLGGPGARTAFESGRERAHELHLLAWERRFRTRLLWLDFHAGQARTVFEQADVLLAEAVDEWQRFLLVYLAAQAATDLGLFERAGELVGELDAMAGAGNQRLRQALWARADLELAAGRPAAASAAAERAFALFPRETSAFIRVTHAWAAFELDTGPGPPEIAPRDPLVAGVRPELEGLWRLREGQPDAAAAAFLAAAERWAGRHERGRLRSLWAAGEALRRAGRGDEAVERLVAAEHDADVLEHRPLVARIHRSLRLAGVHRAAGRGAGEHGLTAREQEILALVATGLSNAEIARRLGLGAPTVERLIASASTKLGARSRLQAAALAAGS